MTDTARTTATPAAGPPIVDGIRRPRQARSAETFERFIEATQDLLAERPFDEIGVDDIVARAGRTVGSFYARFDDKHAVLYALVERVEERLTDLVHAFCDPVRWEGVPVGDWLLEAVRLHVAARRRLFALHRASLVAAVTDHRFRELRIASMAFIADQQRAFLRTRADELRVDDVDRASDAAVELLVALLDHRVLFGTFEDDQAEDATLVEELTTRCAELLGVDPPTSEENP